MHILPPASNQNALSWRKSALAEHLGEASLALETFSENTADSGPLRQCLNHLQQMASALQRWELKGANLLTAEIEALGKSILAQKVAANIPILEALSRGIVSLQSYLKYLEAGKKDCPLSVLAAINDLRVAREEVPQAAIELFEPDLAAPLPFSLNTATLEDAELRSLAARLRLQYEAALLQWFRNPSDGGLPLLAQVIIELRQHAHSETALRLWWLAQGITEALQEGGLQASQEIKLLLGNLDKHIKTLAQKGEPTLAASIPESLLKSLLLHVAKATSSGAEVTAIKAAYHLDRYTPADRTLLTLLGMEAVEAVLTSLGEELEHAKDLLDILTRTPQPARQNLATLGGLLHKLADTLEILRFNAPHALLRQPLGRLEHQIRTETTLDEAQQRELAHTLLAMESLLEKETFLSRYEEGKGPSAQSDVPSSLCASKSNVLQTAQQAAIKECLAELAIAAHILTDFPADSQKLISLDSKIQQLAAVLSTLGLDPAAALLMDCRRCLCEVLIEKKVDHSASPLPLEALAAALAVLERYLEMEVAGAPASDSLLDMATARLAPVIALLGSPAANDGSPPPAPEEEHAPPKPELLLDAPDELVATFLEEAEELLQTSQALLSAWQQAPSEEGVIAELQRKLHTLKGGAHLAGMTSLAELAHHMETMLSVEISDGQAPAPALLERLQCCLDRSRLLCDYAQGGGSPPSVADLLTAIERRDSSTGAPKRQTAPVECNQGTLSEGAPPPLTLYPQSSEASPATPLPVESRVLPVEQVRIRADMLERLFNHATELEQSCSQMGHQVETLSSNLGEIAQMITRLTEQLHGRTPETEENPHFDRPAQTAPEPRQDLGGSINNLIRFEKTLQETAQEIGALHRQQAHLSAQLQQDLKNTELLPFAGIAPRLQRVVHHGAQELNKHVRLEISGDAIELKQALLNRLLAPLEHMLRNSISHGIESPSERIAAGKEETGTIHLSLTREESEILIQVADDGRGIDLEKVRTTALARDLIQAQTPSTDESLMRLILEPGFSTADTLSPLAGRGIGMDIVANEIHRLHGSLEIASNKGKGATFTLRFPCP